MALVTPTLSAAASISDTTFTVSASTSIAAGNIWRCDGESGTVTSAYVSGSTSVPVVRAQGGTAAQAHPSGANISFGVASDTAWGSVGTAVVVPYPPAGRTRSILSYSATGAITLPDPGTDMVAIINGTTGVAMTVADPGKQLDGSKLDIMSNGAATTTTVTFAGGLNGAGSSYDVVTFNTGAPVLLSVTAVNGKWMIPCCPAMTGTVTNLVGAVA